ncbi:MAG: hypothetical protein ABFD97_05825 [Syntrophobacter sp.]
MKVIALIVTAILLALATPFQARAQQPERIYGFEANAEAKTISIVVSSTGCTDKSYFSFAVEGDILTFKRVKRDSCKAMPSRETIRYTLDELGIKPESSFRIGNPISLTERIF